MVLEVCGARKARNKEEINQAHVKCFSLVTSEFIMLVEIMGVEASGKSMREEPMMSASVICTTFVLCWALSFHLILSTNMYGLELCKHFQIGAHLHRICTVGISVVHSLQWIPSGKKERLL